MIKAKKFDWLHIQSADYCRPHVLNTCVFLKDFYFILPIIQSIIHFKKLKAIYYDTIILSSLFATIKYVNTMSSSEFTFLVSIILVFVSGKYMTYVEYNITNVPFCPTIPPICSILRFWQKTLKHGSLKLDLGGSIQHKIVMDEVRYVPRKKGLSQVEQGYWLA